MSGTGKSDASPTLPYRMIKEPALPCAVTQGQLGQHAVLPLPRDKVTAQRKKKNQTAMTTPISIKHPQPSLSSFLLVFAGSDGV